MRLSDTVLCSLTVDLLRRVLDSSSQQAKANAIMAQRLFRIVSDKPV